MRNVVKAGALMSKEKTLNIGSISCKRSRIFSKKETNYDL